MAFPLIMEALARIEHKLDALMRWTGVPMPPPMYFQGALCPGCGTVVDYIVDINHGVVTRRCNCKTGKVPVTIPLTPMQEPKNGTGRDDVPPEDGDLGKPRPNRAGQVQGPKR